MGFFGSGSFGKSSGSVFKAGFPFPTDNLLGWWKFDTGLTLDTNVTTTVAYWLDSSGNGNHFEQATKAKQPLYSAGELRFDGTDDEMTLLTTKLAILRNKPGCAAYMVLNVPSTQTAKWPLWIAQGASTTSYRYGVRIESSDKLAQFQRRVDGGSGFSLTSTNAFTKSVNFLSTTVIDYTGNLANIYKNAVANGNGAAGSTGTTSDTDSGEVVIGSSGTADFSTVYISEIILRSSPAHRTETEAYLMTKFGL